MLANYIMKINVLLNKNNELRLFELNLSKKHSKPYSGSDKYNVMETQSTE